MNSNDSNSETDNTSENTDIQMIMSQCDIGLQQAIELYTAFNGDVVSIIAQHLNPVYKETQKNNKKKEPLQMKFDAMRNIANQKDAMFVQYLDAQKQPAHSVEQQSMQPETPPEPSSNNVVVEEEPPTK